MQTNQARTRPPGSSGRTQPRIVFVVMSAVAPAASVDQLVQALAPHTVLVHHDFSQQPQFHLAASNARFVPSPVRTGWAHFGWVEGIFHSLRHALAELDFDYLQLLSPTCLPIKPLAQFEAHVSGPAEAHFDCVDLLADRDALMHVGYRAFTPAKSFRHRVGRRLSTEYFGSGYALRDVAGVQLRTGRAPGPMPWVAYGLYRAFSHPAVGRHIFDANLRPYYGSAWFGARPHVVRALVDKFARPDVHDYFSRLWIAEEFLFPTLLMQVAGKSKGPLSHYVHVFDEAHPRTLVDDDLELLRAQTAFFARKFPSDPASRLRHRALQELCGLQLEDACLT